MSLNLGLGLSLAPRGGGGPFASYPALKAAVTAGRAVDVMGPGDSILAGFGSAASGQYQLSSSIAYMAALNAAGYTAIDGFLWNDHNSGDAFAYDTRLTSPIPARWSASGLYFRSTTVGAQFTFAHGVTHDRVRKGYITSPTNGTYTLTKNAVVIGTIVEGASVSYSVTTYSPTSGSQAIVLDYTVAGAGAQISPLPFIQVYPSATQHIQVCQVGQAGWTTANWATAASGIYDPLDVLITLAGHRYGIMLGTNDAATGVPVATSKTNLQTIITRLKTAATNPDVVLMSPPPAGGTSIGSNVSGAFLTALAELTATNSLPAIIDINGFLSPWDFHEYDTDNLHPKAATHVLIGQYIAAKTLGTALPTRPARPASKSGWGSAGTNVTVSGTNSVTAANTTATEWNVVRTAGTKTDRRFFEVKLDAMPTGFCGIGVGNAAQALDGYWGASSDMCIMSSDGNSYYNNIAVSTGLGAIAVGDTIGVDIDPVGQQIRWQKNGGVFSAFRSIPLVGGTVYGMAFMYDNGTQLTINATETAPSGSASWTP